MAAPGAPAQKAGGVFPWGRVGTTFAAAVVSWVCLILSVAGFLYATGLGFQFREENRHLVDQGLQVAQSLADEARSEIEGALGRATSTVNETARNLLKGQRPDEAELLAAIRAVIYSNPGFVEAGVAFAPFAYDPQLRLYGLSYVVEEDGAHLRDLDVDQDYTQRGTDWYHRPLAGAPVWLEPRYDNASRQVVATYAVPLFEKGAKKPVGVVYATYALRPLQRTLDALKLGENGYAFLLSSSQRVALHPNKNYIGRQWTFDDFLDRLSGRSEAKALKAALTDPSQTASFTDPDTGLDARIFFRKIPATAWTLGVSLAERDLQLPRTAAHRELIRIALVLGLSLVLLTAFLSGAVKGSSQALWLLSSVFAAGCVLNTGFVLWLEKGAPPPGNAESVRITNQNALNQFMSEQLRRTLAQHEAVPLFIPTGIYVQSMSFASGDDVRMSGYVWQRYTQGVPGDVERGFLMPRSKSLEVSEPHPTRAGNTEVVLWNFTATLDQNFDYSRYPFGRQYVRAQLRHKDFTNNVVLVPDLESYDLITPAARPGLERDLLLSGWDIKDSYFSYRPQGNRTSFGLGGSSGFADVPELSFNVGLEKLITGVFVVNILPLMVVFILLFGMLFLATAEGGRGGMLGFTLDVIIGCAAFFLVAIFSHIAMRRGVGARELFYLEYYYFVAYTMILFVTMNYVHFTKTPIWLLRYRDNFIPKVIYWPVGLLAILILTLAEFY